MTQQPNPFSELRGLIAEPTDRLRAVAMGDPVDVVYAALPHSFTTFRGDINHVLNQLPALLDERDRLIASMDKPAILAALRSFRFNDVGFDDDGSPMPLVDMLALESEPDIGNALQREDDLADHLYAELVLTARQALSQEIEK